MGGTGSQLNANIVSYLYGRYGTVFTLSALGSYINNNRELPHAQEIPGWWNV